MIEITQNLGKTMTYDLSYQECNDRPLVIRAYYGSLSNYYRQSQPFTVTRQRKREWKNRCSVTGTFRVFLSCPL